MNPMYTAIGVLVTPILTELLKKVLSIDPEAKIKMKIAAAALTAIAAALNAASGNDISGLTEILLTGLAMFFAQDGLYNTVFKPLFDRLKKAPEPGPSPPTQ